MRRVRIGIIAAFLASWSFVDAPKAADVKIGSTSISLPLLPGYCEIDPVVAEDARLIAALHRTLTRTGHRLLLMTADCAELIKWRDRKRAVLDHMAQYQTLLANEQGPLPDAPEVLVKRYCDEMQAVSDRAMPGSNPDAQERAEDASKGIRTSEIKHLGVVAQEPLACVGTLHKFAVENAGEFTQATVIAAMIVKDKIMICYVTAPYVGRETISALLARQRVNVSQMQRAN